MTGQSTRVCSCMAATGTCLSTRSPTHSPTRGSSASSPRQCRCCARRCWPISACDQQFSLHRSNPLGDNSFAKLRASPLGAESESVVGPLFIRSLNHFPRCRGSTQPGERSVWSGWHAAKRADLLLVWIAIPWLAVQDSRRLLSLLGRSKHDRRRAASGPCEGVGLDGPSHDCAVSDRGGTTGELFRTALLRTTQSERSCTDVCRQPDRNSPRLCGDVRCGGAVPAFWAVDRCGDEALRPRRCVAVVDSGGLGRGGHDCDRVDSHLLGHWDLPRGRGVSRNYPNLERRRMVRGLVRRTTV